MKILIYIFLLVITLTSCKEKAVCQSCDREVEMRITGEALDSFYSAVNIYYSKMENTPNWVIRKTDSLLINIKNNPDPHSIRWNKLLYLSALRTETYYRAGEYQKSIDEIYSYNQSNLKTPKDTIALDDRDCIYLACNYVKLKEFNKAKTYLYKSSNGYYITNFIRANYYEVIKNKDRALEIYTSIANEKSMSHYNHYQESLKRIDELNKVNPVLLTELFYPTSKDEH